MSVINDAEFDGAEFFVCDDTLIRKGADAAVPTAEIAGDKADK